MFRQLLVLVLVAIGYDYIQHDGAHTAAMFDSISKAALRFGDEFDEAAQPT